MSWRSLFLTALRYRIFLVIELVSVSDDTLALCKTNHIFAAIINSTYD